MTPPSTHPGPRGDARRLDRRQDQPERQNQQGHQDQREQPAAPAATSARGTALGGRAPRTSTTVHGAVAIALGLPFIGVGAAVVALLARTGDVAGGARVVFPPVAAVSLGLTFALAGIALVAHGARWFVRRRQVAVRRRRFPEQPWLWDYPWERRAGRDEVPDEAGRLLAFALALGLFLVPFHWVAFLSPDRPALFQIVTAIFELIGVAMLGRVAYLTLRRLRYGPSRLRFATFPIAPDSEAELPLDAVSPRARAHPMKATLRCVEEREEVHVSGRERETRTVCYELWRDERAVAPGEGSVSFTIPPGAPSTALAALPPRYWELELTAEARGVDYGARFLVPVYG